MAKTGIDKDAFAQRRGKTDEISLALQLTEELKMTATLHQILTETLPRVSEGAIPPPAQLTKLNENEKMVEWTKGVMIGMKKDYSEQTLTTLSRQPYVRSFTTNYPKIIDQNIREIMSAG